jgi:hypothetical protein
MRGVWPLSVYRGSKFSNGPALPGDALFIVGGALPLLWLCWQALRHPNPRRTEAEAELPRMLYTYDSEAGK